MTVDGLAGEAHAALNASAVPRRPRAGLLPARVPPTSRPLPVAPAAAVPPGDLAAVLARRRSRYAFGGQPTPAELSALLGHGVGTAPRAGGLPSLLTYVVAADPGHPGHPGRPDHPGAVSAGVHLADPRLPIPGLVALRAGDPSSYVAEALDQPRFADRVPLWLVLVADLAATRGRYPARHYRTLHVDAGAALQNVLLVATALGLRSCAVMGYDDQAWARLLDLSEDRFVTVLVALGRPPAG